MYSVVPAAWKLIAAHITSALGASKDHRPSLYLCSTNAEQSICFQRIQQTPRLQGPRQAPCAAERPAPRPASRPDPHNNPKP